MRDKKVTTLQQKYIACIKNEKHYNSKNNKIPDKEGIMADIFNQEVKSLFKFNAHVSLFYQSIKIQGL